MEYSLFVQGIIDAEKKRMERVEYEAWKQRWRHIADYPKSARQPAEAESLNDPQLQNA